MKITFWGAASEVTGSCFLVETSKARVLVDLGLFQGGEDSDRPADVPGQTKAERNALPPIDPARLSAVVLTHAHLDHSGRLPLLTKDNGSGGGAFKGRVWCTGATMDLARVLLLDAANIQEQDAQSVARRLAREGKTDRPAPEPIYRREDVENVMGLFKAVEYRQERVIADGISVEFFDAGHILGSASVRMTVQDGSERRVIVFSGDLADPGLPLLSDADPPVPGENGPPDLVLLESTYGDRDHRSLAATIEEFRDVLMHIYTEREKLLIPSFAVGRTQQLIYFIRQFKKAGEFRDLPVYIDSPMAISATELYKRHRNVFDHESRAMLSDGDNPLDFPGLAFCRTRDESMALNDKRGAMVIIAGSGMCTGGRIMHHLRHNLARPAVHVVFPGYQAVGTLGRALVDGAKQVWIAGERVNVNATLHTIGGFSAHAGQTNLVKWAAAVAGGRGPRTPRFVLTHGEDRQMTGLKAALEHTLGAAVSRPERGEAIEL